MFLFLLYLFLLPDFYNCEYLDYCKWSKINKNLDDFIIFSPKYYAINNEWANICNYMLMGSFNISNYFDFDINIYTINNTCYYSEENTFIKDTFSVDDNLLNLNFTNTKTIYLEENIEDFGDIKILCEWSRTSIDEDNKECPLCNNYTNGYYLGLCYGNCSTKNFNYSYYSISQRYNEVQCKNNIPLNNFNDILIFIIYFLNIFSWCIPTNKKELTLKGYQCKIIINLIEKVWPNIIYRHDYMNIIVKNNIRPTQLITMNDHKLSFLNSIYAGKYKLGLNLISLVSMYYTLITKGDNINYNKWNITMSLSLIGTTVITSCFYISSSIIINKDFKKRQKIILFCIKTFILLIGGLVIILPFIIIGNVKNSLYFTILPYSIQFFCWLLFDFSVIIMFYNLYIRYWSILIGMDINYIGIVLIITGAICTIFTFIFIFFIKKAIVNYKEIMNK